MNRSNFRFGKGLGFINSLAATKTAELIAAPLELLKLNVERLLKEYKPPEHRVDELELTWKGGLWRMALEAALGVQYLHHHRYERHAAKRAQGGMSALLLLSNGAAQSFQARSRAACMRFARARPPSPFARSPRRCWPDRTQRAMQ
jgi:hypothetical protein